jgi:serine protease Do
MRRILVCTFVLVVVAGAQVSFVAAADVVRPSLVSIVTDRVTAAESTGSAVESEELGSGFVLDTLGHILTCNHVVDGYVDVTVKLADGKAHTGSDVVVVGQDPITDLAVIRVAAAAKLAPALLGNSDDLAVGQPVMAMGSPFGLEGTATAGIVSALSRWGLAKSTGPDFQDFIQTDALINPGNSGGPLVDTQGRVIGVSSFVRTQRSGPTGIGFATPINLARSVADQLIRSGRVTRGYLGISTQPLTDAMREALGLRTRVGILVSSVDPGRPGDKAGIAPGDVIVTVDGRPVTDVRSFQNEVAGRIPGTNVTLGLGRLGQRKTVTATLGAWVVPTQSAPRRLATGHWLGFVARDLRAGEAPADGPSYGIVITEVEGGEGADAGLKPGDVISEVNLAPVRNLSDFARIEQVMKGNQRPLLLRVFRGREYFYTTAKP